MRRTAPEDPHRHHQVRDHVGRWVLGTPSERKESLHGEQRRKSACRCSLWRIFTLLVTLFFALTFHSVSHLSGLEKTTLFLIPEKDVSAGVSHGSRAHSSDGALGRSSGTAKNKKEENRNVQKSTKYTWMFDPADAEKMQRYLLQTTGRTSPPLTAYVEAPLLNDTATLPLRTQGPDDLRSYTYPQVNGCSELQAMLPTLHPTELDGVYGSNVFNQKPLYAKRFEYAKDACAVDADPFLPWIHDVFPSKEYVEFIAHNKRKCNTDPKVFHDDLRNLEPQVAIMQPVSVQRISNDEAQSIAPNLWHDNNDKNLESTQRYRLVSHDEADPDGRETRFICRFYSYTLDKVPERTLRKVVLGETLSVFPYNYEFANYKKPGSKLMLTPVEKGKDEQIWNSVLHFRCPIPVELQSLIASGQSVVNDVASLYLDLVPIRTRPRRTREGYISGVKTEFDPNVEWGKGHVLPLIEASGRYSNIPICRPLILDVESAKVNSKDRAGSVMEQEQRKVKIQQQEQGQTRVNTGPRYYLAGCLWASASYTTRGNGVADTSTSERLLEWLTYHLHIANFDHIYVYDNTAAFANHTSLAAVLSLFPSSRVSRIPWPHRVCNNNRPMHLNPGERSSQYAAEASCRVRYGPHAHWLAVFDADEYLLTSKNWTDLQHWLKGVDNNTHILSFFQTRARPIADLMDPFADGRKCGRYVEEAKCLAKRTDTTFMETYDCESTPLPKPDWAWRAKKQLFQPWYVLNHYVHYSVVTKRLLDAPNEVSPRFVEKYPYERRVDELTEAFMLHTKTTTPEATVGWKEKCTHDDSSCPVGIPWPSETTPTNVSRANSDGLKYNCYRHEGVMNLLPKLKSLLTPLLERYHSAAHGDTALA